MRSKDYYKILEVNSNASHADIKKSYRRLAMKYHPDKDFDDKVSELKFKDIQEAYHVLSDTKRRQQYNHKQYDEKHGLSKKSPPKPTTSQAILDKAIQLRKKAATMDPHRLDRDSLLAGLLQILSAHNISILHKDNNSQRNTLIVEEILQVASMLQYQQTQNVCKQLAAIAGTNMELQQRMASFEQKQKMASYWNRYQLIAVLIVVTFFCFLIYSLST